MAIDIDKLNGLLNKVDTTDFRRSDYAALFVWYLTEARGEKDCQSPEIRECFSGVNLNVPTLSDLRRVLAGSPGVIKGLRSDSYKINRNALSEMQRKYGGLLSETPSPSAIIQARLDVSKTPFLSAQDVNNAYNMAGLYVAIHCLENSVRQFIRVVLSKSLGAHWWDEAASEGMVKKVLDRKSREAKKRWLTSRGADELHYLDWSDLITLVRKFHKQFETFIPELKFIELRLEELENLRNTIAHSGVLPDEEVTRVELALRDWCRQVSV